MREPSLVQQPFGSHDVTTGGRGMLTAGGGATDGARTGAGATTTGGTAIGGRAECGSGALAAPSCPRQAFAALARDSCHCASAAMRPCACGCAAAANADSLSSRAASALRHALDCGPTSSPDAVWAARARTSASSGRIIELGAPQARSVHSRSALQQTYLVKPLSAAA